MSARLRQVTRLTVTQAPYAYRTRFQNSAHGPVINRYE
jgi:hypothetical protein